MIQFELMEWERLREDDEAKYTSFIFLRKTKWYAGSIELCKSFEFEIMIYDSIQTLEKPQFIIEVSIQITILYLNKLN